MNTTPNNDGGPAFPLASDMIGHCSGMTLRDWLAGMALQGYLAGRNQVPSNPSAYVTEMVATTCTEYADALITALYPTQQEQPASEPEQEPTPRPSIAVGFPPLPKGIPAPPEGFAFVTHGPMKTPSEFGSRNILWFSENQRKWIDDKNGWFGTTLGPWAVRIGSDIAIKNGIGISP